MYRDCDCVKPSVFNSTGTAVLNIERPCSDLVCRSMIDGRQRSVAFISSPRLFTNQFYHHVDDDTRETAASRLTALFFIVIFTFIIRAEITATPSQFMAVTKSTYTGSGLIQSLKTDD